MKLTIEKEWEYIPFWNNNQADSEPIKFILCNLTTAERDSCVELSFDQDGKPIFKSDNQRIFKAGVRQIENLSVNGEKISSATGVMTMPGLYELFLEVASEILAKNMRRDSKNLP